MHPPPVRFVGRPSERQHSSPPNCLSVAVTDVGHRCTGLCPVDAAHDSIAICAGLHRIGRAQTGWIIRFHRPHTKRVQHPAGQLVTVSAILRASRHKVGAGGWRLTGCENQGDRQPYHPARLKVRGVETRA